MELSTIFEYEHKEDWETVSTLYVELYQQNPSQDVAMHFAFFCWYLLWQWDEISFLGETLSPYEKATVDTRNGISKTELLSNLDLTTQYLLTSLENTPQKYLVLLSLMKKIYPYFFKEETFSEVDRKKLFVFISQRTQDDLGTKVIYNYLQTQSTNNISPSEKVAVTNLFPKYSLIQSYFSWLFN